MSQGNQNNNHGNALTKIFVGGLPWATTTESLRAFFQQFGEVIDGNVVRETYPGRSKGYGFVTFRDAASAARALENPEPVIEGRTANCNLASQGVQKNMKHPNQNGSLKRAGPSHRYQPSFQYVHPNNSPITWNPYLGQYTYMYYNNPWYPYPTPMQPRCYPTNSGYVHMPVPPRPPVRIRSNNINQAAGDQEDINEEEDVVEEINVENRELRNMVAQENGTSGDEDETKMIINGLEVTHQNGN